MALASVAMDIAAGLPGRWSKHTPGSANPRTEAMTLVTAPLRAHASGIHSHSERPACDALQAAPRPPRGF